MYQNKAIRQKDPLLFLEPEEQCRLAARSILNLNGYGRVNEHCSVGQSFMTYRVLRQDHALPFMEYDDLILRMNGPMNEDYLTKRLDTNIRSHTWVDSNAYRRMHCDSDPSPIISYLMLNIIHDPMSERSPIDEVGNCVRLFR